MAGGATAKIDQSHLYRIMSDPFLGGYGLSLERGQTPSCSKWSYRALYLEFPPIQCAYMHQALPYQFIGMYIPVGTCIGGGKRGW